MCREIYEYLAQRCDCNLVAGRRLHVVPSLEITINVRLDVTLDDLNYAAPTQQEIAERLRVLVEDVWRKREIGRQISIHEIYRTVKGVENVRSIGRILPEGVYYREGRRCVTPIDGGEEFSFATVQSGSYSVQIN